MGFANATFTGNLGRDPETFDFGKDGTGVRFSLGVNVGYGDNKKSYWVKVTSFNGKTADACMEYLKKGSKVLVNGEIALTEYENKEKEKKQMLELNASRVEFLDGGNGGGNGGEKGGDREERRSSSNKDSGNSRSSNRGSSGRSSNRSETSGKDSGGEFSDDDCPF
jgi:single-strand DNA-binding protein